MVFVPERIRFSSRSPVLPASSQYAKYTLFILPCSERGGTDGHALREAVVLAGLLRFPLPFRGRRADGAPAQKSWPGSFRFSLGGKVASKAAKPSGSRSQAK